VSVATTLKRCKGGQFVTHVQALPGNPYDGHTLAGVIPAIEGLLGNTIERVHTDAGYRGLRWSHFLGQPAKVGSSMRMTDHEDAETVFV
jgi:hypothetical protein